MPVLQFDITSQWERADDTQNHLDLAETEIPDLRAIRSNRDRSRVIYATVEQIREFADRVNDPDSNIGRMLENGRRHEHNGGRNGRDRDSEPRGRDRSRDLSSR
jgi:hypothetical protein